MDFERNILSANAFRHPPAVPALEDVRQRLPDLAVQTHPVAEDSSRTAVRMDHLGNLVARGEHEGRRADAALPARQIPAHVAHHQPQERPTSHVHRIGVGPVGDVVAEQRRKLVGVGVTTDPPDQVGVVHRGPLLLVEAHPFGDARRDQRRPKHVLHRLSQTEIDRQRYRRQQLGSAQAFCRVLRGPVRLHALIVTCCHSRADVFWAHGASAPCAETVSGQPFQHGCRQYPTRDRSAAAVGQAANGRPRAFGAGTTGVSLSALGAAMQGLQQSVRRPGRTCFRRRGVQPVA